MSHSLICYNSFYGFLNDFAVLELIVICEDFLVADGLHALNLLLSACPIYLNYGVRTWDAVRHNNGIRLYM